MEDLQANLLKLRLLYKDLLTNYTTWIKNKPSHASDIETTVKIFSYFLHGRCKNSSVLPELLYCASNLLSFWHDTLLKAEAERLLLQQRPAAAGAVPPGLNPDGASLRNGTLPNSRREQSADNSNRISLNEVLLKRIKVSLTILEYFEVFLEVGAKAVWGDVGRWLVILITQTIKAGLRLILLLHFKVGLIQSPAILPLDRKSQIADNSTGQLNTNIVFILRHSGRVVRKINASPSLAARTWKLPSVPEVTVRQTDLPPLRFLAEVLHILRPLAHLTSLGVWGTKSWKPWMMSLALDITSLQLHGKPDGNMKNSEKIELTRRTYTLLYYLIRSPFYDRFTKQRLLTSLVRFSDKIPIVGHLCSMLAEAIPEWQHTYSYAWNDF